MVSAPDVLIVGGGPAGAAAAFWLARAGCRTVILEREAGSRPRVCGEFLSAAAGAELARLGLDLRALGAARIERLRLVHGRKELRQDLPFAASGLSRQVLDEEVLARAAAAGADVRRGVAVRTLTPDDGGWRAGLADGTRITGPAVFLATGKHDLRGHGRRPNPGGDPIGFKMHWRLRPDEAAALCGHIELFWFAGGYAGLQPIEGGRANLSLVIGADAYTRLGKTWTALLDRLRDLAPHLARRLRDAAPATRQPAAIAGMPYGYIHTSERDRPGLYRLGDQFAVIPSFTGEGMALALRTGRLAAAALLAGMPARVYHDEARAHFAPVIGFASRLVRLAQHPLAQAAIVRTCSALPGLLPLIAQRTRLRPAGPAPAATGPTFSVRAGNPL